MAEVEASLVEVCTFCTALAASVVLAKLAYLEIVKVSACVMAQPNNAQMAADAIQEDLPKSPRMAQRLTSQNAGEPQARCRPYSHQIHRIYNYSDRMFGPFKEVTSLVSRGPNTILAPSCLA